MQSMIKLLTFFAIAGAPCVALSDEVNPFGLLFGGNPEKTYDCRVTDTLSQSCSINPPTRSKFYEKYYVRMTPTTNQMFQVLALTKYDDKIAAQEAFLAVNGALQKKYGPGYKKTGMVTDTHTFSSGPISIVSEWTGEFGTQTLRLRYIHRELVQKSKDEAREIREQNANDAGEGL